MAFTPKITTVGLAAAVAAGGSSLSVAITHIALGSGAYDPTGAETALVNRRETATIAAGSAAPGVVAVIASFVGYSGAEYDLGEVGFYIGDPGAGGILFAVASRAGLRYAVRNSSVGTYTAEYDLTLSGVPSGSVTVTIDPTAAGTAALLAGYVRKVGDTMTGPLVLAGNAVSALQAVPKQQLDAAIGSTAQSLTTDGYKVLPGGLVIMWGKYTSDLAGSGGSEASASVTFPTITGASAAGFPSTCLNVSVTAMNPTPDPTADSGLALVSQLATGFSVTTVYAAGVTNTVHGFSWFAIGF